MEPIELTEKTEGWYFVKFKEGSYRNDALPAFISRYDNNYKNPRLREYYSGKINVQWLNGNSCVTKPEKLEAFKINQL